MLQKDIILVAGPSASGKSYTIKYLREQATLYGVPFEEKVISDSSALLNRVKVDDILQGFHHTHEWNPDNTNGHTHKNNISEIPFTTIGHFLADGRFFDFFYSLTLLPKTEKLWFVEWSGGLNINESISSPLRYRNSFEKVGIMLQMGILPSQWLSRVHAIIHPVTKNSIRIKLNSIKLIPTPEDIRNGTASWSLSNTAMKLYSKDDFYRVAPILERNGIKNMYHVKNIGSVTYTENLTTISQDVFQKEKAFSTRFSQKCEKRDIIIVAGIPGSGKKTCMKILFETAQKLNILCNKTYLSDFDILLRKIREDDRKGGFNHYHEWCKEQKGHNHSHGEIHEPFIVINENFNKERWYEYFRTLNNLPRNNKMWFVEWTGGVNINKSLQSVDRSYKSMGNIMKQGIYPSDWLFRVRAIIHPMTDDSLRSSCDELQNIKELENIKHDSVSPKKNIEIFQLFGKDDFFELEKIFHESSIGNIHHFNHYGLEQLTHYASTLASIVL